MINNLTLHFMRLVDAYIDFSKSPFFWVVLGMTLVIWFGAKTFDGTV